MKHVLRLLLLAGCCCLPGWTYAATEATVHMANGLKVGEVTDSSAIVWTRLTRNPERVRSGLEFLKPKETKAQRKAEWDGMEQIPAGRTLAEMEGSVPGAAGEVRLRYWPEGKDGEAVTTQWMPVEPDRDFTRQFPLTGLKAGTDYRIEAEGRAAAAGSVSIKGHFKTAPTPDRAAPVSFCVVTCAEYPLRDDAENGHRIYQAMLAKIRPDFFVHTGDIEYYDRPGPFAPSVALARFKMNRMFAMPFIREFHKQTSSYFMKDDHDTTKNDAWPGQNYGAFRWKDGLAVFREQFPMGERTYRTARWGRDLQVWMVEGRDFRSPNNMPDGPDKTIWGAKQKQWFFDTVKASDATFRILITPTPIVGPDRENKNDNYANKGFRHEGDEIRRFIGGQKNMFVVCGDRHWQYASVDPATGVREFGCGPSSDAHAGGFSDHAHPMHRYFKLAGGFLSVQVQREGGTPAIVFRHCAVDGGVNHQERFTSESK